ncbi:MAG TPA: hypothetical protein VGF84_05265 [Micromonosporaceae bacterium]|jgi:hypothetical protein
MDESAEAAVPASGNDGEPARARPRRLTRSQRERLRTVSDSAIPEGYRDLIDRRYPWQRRPYYPVPGGVSALFVFGVLIAAMGAADPPAILVGVFLAAVAVVAGVGPNVLLWRNERWDKRIYDVGLEASVPAVELVSIAEEQPELGVLIWRIQQAVDGVCESETQEQELLSGIVELTTLTDAQYDLVARIVDLAAERELLAQADGRPALDDLLRPRRDAAATWLATITASVEQLEAIHAEVALLDEHLADLRIAEEILGHESSPIRELPATTSEPGGLEDAATGIRAVREFVIAHQPGNAEPQ